MYVAVALSFLISSGRSLQSFLRLMFYHSDSLKRKFLETKAVTSNYISLDPQLREGIHLNFKYSSLFFPASGLLNSEEVAQEYVVTGVGLLAGSSILLLTLLWGTCVLLGSSELRDGMEPNTSNSNSSNKFSWKKFLSSLKGNMSRFSSSIDFIMSRFEQRVHR